jgi:hypothetical protein
VAEASEATQEPAFRWRIFSAGMILFFCSLVAAAYGLTQDRIIFGHGYPYDGSTYMAMAEEVSQGEVISGSKPFVYRVGLPYLVGTFFPNNLIEGFWYINLLFGALTLLLLGLFLSSFTRSTAAIFVALLLFVMNPLGPLRVTHFEPAWTDWPGVFIALLILYVGLRWPGFGLTKISAITMLSFIGVLFREMVLIAPLSLLCASVVNLRHSAKMEWASRNAIVPCVVPVAAALIGIFLTHFWVQPLEEPFPYLKNLWDSPVGGYTFLRAGFNTAIHNLFRPQRFVLAIFISYGPVISLLLVQWKTAFLEPLRRRPELAAFLVLDLILSIVGGGTPDRFLFWAFPVVLPLLAIAIDQLFKLRPSVASVALMASLLVAQILAFRAFAPIPNTAVNVYENVGSPSFLIFAPYGPNTNWAQAWAGTMGFQSSIILLSENILFVGWVYFLCRKGNLFGMGVAPHPKVA